MPDAPPLNTPLQDLPAVGKAVATKLRKLGLCALGDVLDYFPRDYRAEAGEGSISAIVPDQIHTLRGEVVAVNYIGGYGRKGRFEATLDDGTGRISLTWFGGAYLRSKIHPGQHLKVRGKVGMFRNLHQMTNPAWEEVDPEATPVGSDATKPADSSVGPVLSEFRPVYPATQGVTSDAIARIFADLLPVALPHITEWFTADLLKQRELIARPEAYRLIHQPTSAGDAAAAHKRLVYDELMLLQLGLMIARRLGETRLAAPVLKLDKVLDTRIRSRFPFTMTPQQEHAVYEIAKDLGSGNPMNRLLQGDVGSGKTIVAVYAMLMAVANKMQAVLLAPTEVLAEQHFFTLRNLLRDSGVRIDLVTGRTKRALKDAAEGLFEGETHLAVGTQALLGEDVSFANLGLVVVDEQHKLGVRQRAILKDKGYSPHYLVMTATPIPRTLALSFFADFDVTTITALPPGRQPIATRWIRPGQADSAYGIACGEIEKGRQVYVVVPAIESIGDERKSVLAEYEKLRTGAFKNLRVAMLHGQMPAEEKQIIMTRFREGGIDVLVSTTVIEVGIDVPNATVMIIDDAHHFGLSQLHQLRGRVGRGEHRSFCLLLSDAPTPDAEQRLQAMVSTADGFEIAEYDLQLRGPGDFFGTRQHGLPPLKLADVSHDLEMLQIAKDDALALLADDPHLKQHDALREALVSRFGDALGLAAIG